MSDPTPASVRRRVIFRGRVQGVGFRYTVAGVARRYPVAGYVKNLPDGSVELAVETDPATLQAFLDDIASAMRGHVDDTASEELASDEQFDGFRIRY
jgi:acylphosphatase